MLVFIGVREQLYIDLGIGGSGGIVVADNIGTGVGTCTWRSAFGTWLRGLWNSMDEYLVMTSLIHRNETLITNLKLYCQWSCNCGRWTIDVEVIDTLVVILLLYLVIEPCINNGRQN